MLSVGLTRVKLDYILDHQIQDLHRIYTLLFALTTINESLDRQPSTKYYHEKDEPQTKISTLIYILLLDKGYRHILHTSHTPVEIGLHYSEEKKSQVRFHFMSFHHRLS